MADGTRSTLEPATRSQGWAGRLVRPFAQGPVSPGDAFGAPGQGRSVAISVVTSLGLLLLWYVVTWLEMIPPLFGCTGLDRTRV